jgi:thiol:disulfide interchange protein DsbG
MTSLSRSFLSLTLALVMSTPVWAQDAVKKEPPMPAPLEALATEGAQIRYMGNEAGLDGWLAIQDGQEQYFYVTPDREYVLLGLLFDKSGKMVTLRQVSALQKASGASLDILKAEPPKPQTGSVLDGLNKDEISKTLKSPSEKLFADIESSNWVTLGQPTAPVIYTFMDPQCQHCHNLMKDLRADYIDKGLLQVRMIPVGFKDDTKAQAALLLAVPNGQERWYRHLDGDKESLPVTTGVNEQGVERNLSIMQAWKLNVTPLSIYRAKDGSVKVVQGRARDLKAMIGDLATTQ